MPETPEDPRDEPTAPDADADAPAEAETEGEVGRDAVAGQRGGQPGYDLDETELYEQRDADASDE